ncbi:SDR family oxidoreductase [Candidatus Nitrosopumilus sediminis]|uniref:dTDP-4-dehydrorhamnose reductase n=1 Tax=Candidatus Nitrosopumilus sediminis TaxID=1229909 RepID=K0BA85_9ARCH|nr:sugar nucleotide-binding protein [Candidatus Nitrosopumilus sediminis]AFS81870.1 dTDP-4-dehydrorhamnose reductase [Candidatus Nitrosopumilus sediminis]
MNNLKILITGSSGALGSELKKKFPDAITPNHKELDITNKEQVTNFFNREKIDIVIHTAAITSIRKCEEERELTWKTNVDGTINLIDGLMKTNPNGKFVYVSTACVFDGNTGMYDESSIPYPENFYALSKLLGEQEVKKIPNYLIIRTNFAARKKWPYPKAFSDRFGTYLFADDVATGIVDVINSNKRGIIHIVGDEKISMLELARITTPDIQPMTIKDYSGPKLTMDMSLDSKKWKKYKISKN